jgi:crotonobetainyl-CoA:carnitine CoA-transferase CaiB-like acyl-CoA transferase
MGYNEHPDRQPIRVGGYHGEAFSGLMAALATNFAILKQQITGEGEHIDLSKQEAQLHNHSRGDAAGYANDGVLQSRATRDIPSAGPVLCVDGYVQVHLHLNDASWGQLMEGMGNPEWAQSAEFQDEANRQKQGPVIMRRLGEWIQEKGLTKHEAYHLIQKSLGSLAGGVETPMDLINSPQLGARGYFAEVDHPVAGSFKYAGLPFEFSQRERRKPQPAPLLGQHNELVYCERLAHSRQELALLRGADII